MDVAESVLPGGLLEHDFDGKILIEFSYYNSLALFQPDFHKSYLLAFREISESVILPVTY